MNHREQIDNQLFAEEREPRLRQLRGFLRCLRLEFLRMRRQDMAGALLGLIVAGYGASVVAGGYEWYSHYKHSLSTAPSAITVASVPDSVLSVQEPALRPLFTAYDVGFPVYSIHSLGISDTASSTKQEEMLATPAGITLIGLSLLAVLVGVQVGAADTGGQNLATVISGKAYLVRARAVRACAGLLFVCGAYACSVLSGCLFLAAVQVDASPLIAKQGFFDSLFGAFYLGIFVLLGALCGSKARQPAKGMAIAVGVWLTFVMIVPQALPPLARLALGPLNSSVQVENAIANIRTHNQDVANFTASHLPPQDTDAITKLYRQSEGDTLHQLVTLEQRQQASLAKVAFATRSAGLLDPALALQSLMLMASGYDPAKLFSFRQSLLDYKLDVAQAVFAARERHTTFKPARDWRAVAIAPHLDRMAALTLCMEFAVLLIWFLYARESAVYRR